MLQACQGQQLQARVVSLSISFHEFLPAVTGVQGEDRNKVQKLTDEWLGEKGKGLQQGSQLEGQPGQGTTKEF